MKDSYPCALSHLPLFRARPTERGQHFFIDLTTIYLFRMYRGFVYLFHNKHFTVKGGVELYPSTSDTIAI